MVRFLLPFFPALARILGCALFFRGMRVVLVDPVVPSDISLAESFYQLRDDVFAKKHGWEEPRGQERDKYDRASLFLVIMKGNKAVAGCRIIRKRALQDKLPVEECLGDISLDENSVEISRMINTTGSKFVFFALHLAVFSYVKKGGFSGVFATIREIYLRKKLAKVFGTEYFEQLPGRVLEKGSERFIPVRIAI